MQRLPRAPEKVLQADEMPARSAYSPNGVKYVIERVRHSSLDGSQHHFLMLARLTTSTHFAISALTNGSISASGVSEGTLLRRRYAASPSDRRVLLSPPASASVGTSGNSGDPSLLVTARARTLPLLIWPNALDRLSKNRVLVLI
jgi:hypothetical protein